MGKYRPFIVLGIAVIVALIASVLVYNWLQKKAKVKEVAPLETQTVSVASADLSWGTVLSKDMIKAVPFLKGNLPEGCFSDPASLVGRVLISPVKTNEPIFESRLAPISVKTGGVAAVITPKKRAIAIRVDKTIGVSGFIHPGHRVDVLVTLASGKTPVSITKTVLENILVLTAGPEMETKGNEQKPTNVDVITLEVTPEEAEKLALAANEGKLQLALRNFTDTGDVLTKGSTIPGLLASYSLYAPGEEGKSVTRKVAAGKKPAPGKLPSAVTEKPKPPTFIVELIKGGKSSEVKFGGGEL
jgi:pilus assembly protein CpaB